jgi:hypothetical protein
MSIVNYSDDWGWTIVDLDYAFGIGVNFMERSVICENGRCYIPRPTDFEEHISFFKRR